MKSYVGLGYEVCPICGAEHTESVLLSTRMKDSLEHRNHTGWSLCPDHQSQADQGFVFLVEMASEPTGSSSLAATWHLRTGTIIAIRRESAESIGLNIKTMAFCTHDLTEKLQQMVTPK